MLGICFYFSECICMRSGNFALLKFNSAYFLILSYLSCSYFFIIWSKMRTEQALGMGLALKEGFLRSQGKYSSCTHKCKSA